MGGDQNKVNAQLQKEAQMRLKKFEAFARKPGVTSKDLAKVFKAESDPKNKQKMKAMITGLMKEESQNSRGSAGAKSAGVVGAGPVTSPATPGKPGEDDPRAAKLRLKKFEVAAQKKPDDFRTLEKMAEAETDKKTAVAMMKTVKMLKAKQKASPQDGFEKSRSVSPSATPRPAAGPVLAMTPGMAKAKLKKFTALASKPNSDIKKLEKEVRAEKDPELRRSMEKVLNLAKKKQTPEKSLKKKLLTKKK